MSFKRYFRIIVERLFTKGRQRGFNITDKALTQTSSTLFSDLNKFLGLSSRSRRCVYSVDTSVCAH